MKIKGLFIIIFIMINVSNLYIKLVVSLIMFIMADVGNLYANLGSYFNSF